MKIWLAGLVFGLSLTAATFALAQGRTTDASAPVRAAANTPKVESLDILKQSQAERSKDQPGNLAPTWRLITEGGEHSSSFSAPESGVLIQAKQQFPGQARATTAGEAWRQYRNGPLTKYGGWLLILAISGAAVMYLIRGPVQLKEARTGRLIERFTPVERMVHWTVAISFLILALSGLTMLFGKYILMPLFGHALFGWLAYACKTIHNFVGPVFTVSIIVFFMIYVRDNLPAAADIKWLAQLGGIRGREHASAGRFNAGEKLWFWAGLVVLGLIVSASGFVLDMLMPGVAYTRGNMQIANVIHLVAAVLMTGMAVAHIYIGTIGMEGAYEAMRTGYVDETWAKEHHDLWYEDTQYGTVPRKR